MISDYERLVRRVQERPEPGDVVLAYYRLSRWAATMFGRRVPRREIEKLVVVTRVLPVVGTSWGHEREVRVVEALYWLRSEYGWRFGGETKSFAGIDIGLAWRETVRRAKVVYGQDYPDRERLARMVERGQAQVDGLARARDYLREQPKRDEFERSGRSGGGTA